MDGAVITISLYDDKWNKIGQSIEATAHNNAFHEELNINIPLDIVNVKFVINVFQNVFKEARIHINKPMLEDYLIIQQRVKVIK